MRKLLIGILLGWIFNIGFYEYQYFEHYDLTIDALNQGMGWRYTKKDGTRINPIKNYIESNRTKILDIINFKPNLYKCRYLFTHKDCLIKLLLRSPIPLKNRPKWKPKDSEPETK